MKPTLYALVCSMLALSSVPSAFARDGANSLTVTMTNDPSANAIQVYDSGSHALLATVSTHGKGGVAGNARGVRQFGNLLLAAVNNGSNSVAIFARVGQDLVYRKSLPTSSAPVSLDFANGHLYVAGATTADSFIMSSDDVLDRDGTADLELAGGINPPAGSTAQAGAMPGQLLVTMKSDPTPGTVDMIPLDGRGAIMGAAKAVAVPTGSLTPFGFSVMEDGTALITLAHSSQVGLFRGGQFIDVIISGGQVAPCWTTRIGKYVMLVNAGSQTISREVPTGHNIFIDAAVAATIGTGGTPTDTDANGGVMAVLDHTSSTAHLSFFGIDAFGDLSQDGAITLNAAPAANGVAVLSAAEF